MHTTQKPHHPHTHSIPHTIVYLNIKKYQYIYVLIYVHRVIHTWRLVATKKCGIPRKKIVRKKRSLV
jgi:hypothetical protein